MKHEASITFDNSDFFTYFYQSILSAETLIDFETNLMTFMRRVLKQRTCIFYSNIDSNEDKTQFILQRDSYFKEIDSSLLRKTFPTKLSFQTSKASENTKPKKPKLAKNFFSLSALDSNQPGVASLQAFQRYNSHIRCGMFLQSSNELYELHGELHGLLLYEKPISHPYLNSPHRLQQFQEYLSLSLLYRETVNYATLDQLTQMHHKHYFLNQIEKQLANSQETSYQILMLDIDYFKRFNDSYGHLCGDQCLQAIAKAIKNSVRNHDFTGRFGGEEFICLIQSGREQILSVTERIHATISKMRLQDSSGEPIPTPTISIGVANFCAAEPLNKLIEYADRALYQAKLNGRNQTFVYQD